MDAIPARRLWIQSPRWDLVWMFSALWGCALLATAWALSPLMAVIGVLFLGARLVSVTHSWSTTYMVLASPLTAELRRANPRKYRWVPAGIVLFSLALGLYIASGQRFGEGGSFTGELWAFGLYLLLFWVGHFWHFGNQDFGVLTIYRARAGQDDPADRRADKLYTAAMMFGVQPVVYLGLIGSTGIGELLRAVLPFSPRAGLLAAGSATALALVMSLAAAIRELRSPRRSPPKLLYILVIFLHPTLLFTAVALGQTQLGLMYLTAYLWSHWIIAIGLVGRINARFYRSRGDAPWAAVLRHAAVLSFLAGLVYLATERHKDYLLFDVDGFRYKELLAGITPEQSLVVGLVMGFFLGEQLLHYYCDRCLFRFRDPGVRRTVGPLLLG